MKYTVDEINRAIDILGDPEGNYNEQIQARMLLHEAHVTGSIVQGWDLLHPDYLDDNEELMIELYDDIRDDDYEA